MTSVRSRDRDQRQDGSTIAYLPTVREYDHNVCERLSELDRGIAILEQVIGCERFAQYCGGNFAEILARGREELRILMNDYDMIAVSYLPYGMDNDGTRFKSALLRANIDSRFNAICGVLHGLILQIQMTCGLCAEDNGSSVPRGRGVRTRMRNISRNLADGANERIRDEERQLLRTNCRTALGHISRAESCNMNAMSCNGARAARANGLVGAASSANCADCGAKMRIMLEASEAVCDNCGRVIGIDGLCIIRANTYASGSSGCLMRGRRSGYNFDRHLKIWLDRLQGIEREEFRAEDMAAIRGSIASDYANVRNIRWRDLTCEDVARHLSLCHLSYLGEHTPKLVRLLGGRAPPIIDYDSEQIIFRDFSRIMEVYSILFQGPGNKPYYPFFIGKIIRRRFAQESEIRRLLSYITRQSRETVTRHDKIYEQICNAAPAEYDLIYEPEVI